MPIVFKLRVKLLPPECFPHTFQHACGFVIPSACPAAQMIPWTNWLLVTQCLEERNKTKQKQGWGQNVQKQKEIPRNSSIKSLKLQQWVGIFELLQSFVSVKIGRCFVGNIWLADVTGRLGMLERSRVPGLTSTNSKQVAWMCVFVQGLTLHIASSLAVRQPTNTAEYTRECVMDAFYYISQLSTVGVEMMNVSTRAPPELRGGHGPALTTGAWVNIKSAPK